MLGGQFSEESQSIFKADHSIRHDFESLFAGNSFGSFGCCIHQTTTTFLGQIHVALWSDGFNGPGPSKFRLLNAATAVKTPLAASNNSKLTR